MDNYFDLHFHPIAKNHLSSYTKNATETNTSSDKDLDKLTREVEMSKGFKDYTDEVLLRMLESQCCIEQLDKGNVSLGVAAISALEFGIASGKSFFSDIMKNGMTKPFDKQYFEVVKDGKVSYLNLFLKEVEQYRKLRILKDQKHTKESQLNFPCRFSDEKELSKKMPNLVFGIEGGHNLCRKKIGNALVYDNFEDFGEKAFFDPRTVSSTNPAAVLERLINAFWDAQLDVLYLTLTHLTHIPEQHLATHAFGTKMLKHPSFYPFGNGLSDLGKAVIDKAYSLKAPGSKKGDAALLIDIKHMSLKSRLDLYNHRKKNGYGKIPLIATHVGITGYSITDWKDNLDLKKCVNHVDQGIKTVKIHTTPKVAGYWGSGKKTEFAYNPCTINLMDEDIIEVVNSEGIIGVGLDVRILGYESETRNAIDASEFITTADFMTHFPYTSVQSLDFADTEEIRSVEAWLKPTKKEMHPLSFCFNIVHILAVIGLKTNSKKSPEKYICIGSDFDGFIEPLKICGNSQQMKELESNLLKWLPVAAKKYQKENGGTSDLFEFAQRKESLKKVVVAILYDNGRDFLKQRGYFDDSGQGKNKEGTATLEAIN